MTLQSNKRLRWGNMKQVIGVKSTGDIGLQIFALILLLGLGGVLYSLSGNNLETEQRVLVVAVPFLVLYLIIDIAIQSRKPSTMISCDEENLYLHYTKRTETIPLHQIQQAIPRRAHSRMNSYSFGKVIVYTTMGEHKIGTLSDVESVCIEIMKIAKKHTPKSE